MNASNKFNLVAPDKYTAWPVLGRANDKLVCIYTVADKHSAAESKLFMKTSIDGISWSDGKEVFTDKTGIKGVTGVGNDSEGNLLIWYRDGAPAVLQTKFELYKTDGNTMTIVCKADFDVRGGHIGNIFAAEGNVLFSFYNTYGLVRSFGILKSYDDGKSWEMTPIETMVDKPECPVEIDGFYAGDKKIFALGRKDAFDGTRAMFQLESCDLGQSWSKKYTNITDAIFNSPAFIFEQGEDKIFLYYFDRSTGKLKRRITTFSHIWGNPLGWSDFEILAEESSGGEDTGNVRVVKINDIHLAVYYAGNSTTTGIYGVTNEY